MPTATRDKLAAQARQRGISIAALLEVLAEQAERQAAFAAERKATLADADRSGIQDEDLTRDTTTGDGVESHAARGASAGYTQSRPTWKPVKRRPAASPAMLVKTSFLEQLGRNASARRSNTENWLGAHGAALAARTSTPFPGFAYTEGRVGSFEVADVRACRSRRTTTPGLTTPRR